MKVLSYARRLENESVDFFYSPAEWKKENPVTSAARIHNWFVLTPNGWKEYSNCRQKGWPFFKDEKLVYTSDGSRPEIYFHRNRDDKYFYFKWGEPQKEMTRKELDDIENEKMSQLTKIGNLLRNVGKTAKNNVKDIAFAGVLVAFGVMFGASHGMGHSLVAAIVEAIIFGTCGGLWAVFAKGTDEMTKAT
jgi:hypothetical protein